MKESDLTNPGPNLQGLRRDLARAVSEANANRKQYASNLKSMLDAAIGTDSRDFELPNPGPDWQNLRVSVSKAIRESFVNQKFEGPNLMLMLEQARDGITGGSPGEVGEPPVPGAFPEEPYIYFDQFSGPIDPMVGDTLEIDPGVWSGSEPIAFTYNFYADDVLVQSGPSQEYVTNASDLGKKITGVVYGENDFGSDSHAASSGIGQLPDRNWYMVIDNSYVPNDVSSLSISAGDNPGEVVVDVVFGAPVGGYENQQAVVFLIRVGGSDPDIVNVPSSGTTTVTGLAPGQYFANMAFVLNDVTGLNSSVYAPTPATVE